MLDLSIRCTKNLKPGRPTSNSLQTLSKGKRLAKGSRIQSLVLKWDPEKLDEVGNKKLFKYWASFLTVKDDRIVWTNKVGLFTAWTLTFSAAGVFEFEMFRYKFREPKLEQAVETCWTADHSKLLKYVTHVLSVAINKHGITTTLEPDASINDHSAIRLAQLRLFCSDAELVQLLLSPRAYPYTKKLAARMALFEKLKGALSALKSDIKTLF